MLGALLGIRLGSGLFQGGANKLARGVAWNSAREERSGRWNKRARGVAWNSIGRLVVYCLLTRDNIIDNY